MNAPSDRNPHHVCTWGPEASCAACENQGRLICRLDLGDLLQFALLALNAFAPAVAGMIRGGYGIWLVGYAAFWVFLFGFFEIRILCSHCPFYAERGLILHCPANYGLPKLWRYRPEPMSRLEKALLLVCFVFLFGYPVPFLILGQQYLLLFLTLVAEAVWLVVMQRNVCRRCVNFSCPLNRVPKITVDAYLRRNDVMRQAWEACGYILDEPD